jgi:RNase H-like domain found in reverse transcriptase
MQLLKKEKKFEWTDECTKALDELIHIVASDPVLHRPDYMKPFMVEVDASQYATGAILYQENDKGRLCPVGYHSHMLNPAERGYDIHDRELLAVMQGLRQWRHLFLSSPFQTTVVTDHANLQYYRQPQKINRRIVRYLGDLAEYNFKLVHKPGRLNRADHLSRRPDYDEGKEDNKEVQVLQDAMFANAVVSLNLEQEVYDVQEGQATAIAELQKAYELVSQNHHWFQQGRPVVADKLELKQKILRWYHDHETTGHVTVLWPHRSGRPARPSTSSSNTSSSGASQSALQVVTLDTPDQRTARVLVARRAARQERYDKSAFPARLAEALRRHGMAVRVGRTSTHVMQGIINKLVRLQRA